MIVPVLLNTIIPLCLLVGMGYVAGKYFGVRLPSLSALVIYFFTPAVYFATIVQMDLRGGLFLLPAFMFVLCSAMAMAGYGLARLLYDDNRANLVGMMSVAGNTGLFGLPLVIAVLGKDMAGVCMMANIGLLVAYSTTGYFIGARGHFSARESLIKLLKLPAVYAAGLALVYNFTGLPYPSAVEVYGDYFIGGWVILGMMSIGIALSGIEKLGVSSRFLGVLAVVKLLIWPAAMGAAVLVDRRVTGLFGPETHTMLLIFGLVPLPSMSVSFAAHLDLYPGEAAAAVLLSTLFSIVYIPAAFRLLGIM